MGVNAFYPRDSSPRGGGGVRKDSGLQGTESQGEGGVRKSTDFHTLSVVIRPFESAELMPHSIQDVLFIKH